MNKLKRITVLLLAAITALSCVSFSAAAEGGAESNVIVLYTNDVHCAIDDYTKLAAYRAQLIAEGNTVITVDAGDAVQGEAIGSLTKGTAVADIMNAVGYDIAVPGNHEFDYGMEAFLDIAENAAAYQYLSANFVDLIAEDTAFEPYVIFETGGEKIALLGITTPESYTKSTPTYFQDGEGNYIYSFCENELYDTVQSAVDGAINDGAERVIAVGHLGIEGTTEGWKSVDVISNTEGIDVFIDAHSHEVIEGEVYENKNGENVLLTSTGTKFAYFGQLVLSENGEADTTLIEPDSVIIEELSEEARIKAAEVKDIIDGHNEQLAYLYEELGNSEVYLTYNDPDGNWIIRVDETNLGNFVADAYKNVTGADIAIANGGGIRAEIPAGVVTRKTLMDINPWNNEMCVVEATGQQILDALEHGVRKYPETSGGFPHVAGLTYEIQAWKESPVSTDDKDNFLSIDDTMERRIANVKVNGQAIDPEAVYTVAASRYMLLSGGDGYTMFMDCNVVTADLPTDADMLVQYFTETLNGNITEEQYGDIEGEGRITILTEPSAEDSEEDNPSTSDNSVSATIVIATLALALVIIRKRKSASV